MFDPTQLHQLPTANGWTWVTAACTMLFSLLHFPCATTCWTIAKETKASSGRRCHPAPDRHWDHRLLPGDDDRPARGPRPENTAKKAGYPPGSRLLG